MVKDTILKAHALTNWGDKSNWFSPDSCFIMQVCKKSVLNMKYIIGLLLPIQDSQLSS